MVEEPLATLLSRHNLLSCHAALQLLPGPVSVLKQTLKSSLRQQQLQQTRNAKNNLPKQRSIQHTSERKALQRNANTSRRAKSERAVQASSFVQSSKQVRKAKLTNNQQNNAPCAGACRGRSRPPCGCAGSSPALDYRHTPTRAEALTPACKAETPWSSIGSRGRERDRGKKEPEPDAWQLMLRNVG